MGKRIRAFDMPKLPDKTPEVARTMVVDKIWKQAEDRISFKDIVALLAEHIFANLNKFPPPEKLFVNQIKGVERKKILDVSFYQPP
jgi:hypothetical protein